jgi:hypothetical protein
MSTNQAGKGDKPRPVNRDLWDATWERIRASQANDVPENSFGDIEGNQASAGVEHGRGGEVAE